MRKSKPKYGIVANEMIVSFSLKQWCADNNVSQYLMKKYRKAMVDGITYELIEL
jgi:hypothetical protein